MNAYDFDKTICKDDTETDFFIYELIHHPINLLRIPYFIYVHIRFMLKKITTEQYHEGVYLVLKNLKDIKSEVNKFWAKRKKKILPWYLKVQKEDDVIVTATPSFLIEDLFKELNIKNYIVTDFDVKKRKCNGLYNYDYEKARRFLERYPNVELENFYSDSLGDLPMMKLAKNAYLVDKHYVAHLYKVKK